MSTSVRYIVEDVNGAIDFYRDRLGFAVDVNPAPGFAQLSRGDVTLLLNAPGAGGAGRAGGDPRPGGWNRFQISVDNLTAVVTELKRDGVRCRGEVVEGAGGNQVLIEDPSGNPIELFEPAISSRVSAIPPDAQTLTPFVTVDDVSAFIDFVGEAFGGTPGYTMSSADDVIRHCRLIIGDSQLMVSSGTDLYPPMPCMLHLFVTDVDAAYQAAQRAGAMSRREPQDEFYGDRTAGVDDAWGNQWWLATHVEDVAPEEMERRERAFREEHRPS